MQGGTEKDNFYRRLLETTKRRISVEEQMPLEFKNNVSFSIRGSLAASLIREVAEVDIREGFIFGQQHPLFSENSKDLGAALPGKAMYGHPAAFPSSCDRRAYIA